MDFSNLDPALVLIIVVSLSLAPFVAVMVTSFTKIVVVLSLLRNALGLQQVPPNVVINGLAIVLSIYVMYPVILDTKAAIDARVAGEPPPVASLTTASSPGARTSPPGGPVEMPDEMPVQSPAAADAAQAEAQARTVDADGRFADVEGGSSSTAGGTDTTPDPDAAGSAVAALPPLPEKGAGRLLGLFEAGKEPLRGFLIKHAHDAERAFFLKSAQRLLPPARRDELSINDFIVVVPAFTVGELTAAFQIGFLIFLPFLIIDLVVANILLALGMMMLSPTTISLPFKLLLFVLIDGWAKLVHGLVLTYGG